MSTKNTDPIQLNSDDLRDAVRDHYAAAARRAGQSSACCSSEIAPNSGFLSPLATGKSRLAGLI